MWLLWRKCVAWAFTRGFQLQAPDQAAASGTSAMLSPRGLAYAPLLDMLRHAPPSYASNAFGPEQGRNDSWANSLLVSTQ